MGWFVVGAERDQTTLFPPCLEDGIAENNLVSVVDAFVEALDLGALGFAGVDAARTGRPGYHPAALLKLYVYGYLNRVPSSRRLEREAQRNIEVMWLTGRLAPDHKTIANFRRDNGPATALDGLGDAPITHLVNTHWHFDHADSNAWLSAEGAEILAHQNTRKHLAGAQRVDDWDHDFPAVPPSALPKQVFASEHEIKLNGSTLALKHYGPAHTDSDVSVRFVEADILHTGDTSGTACTRSSTTLLVDTITAWSCRERAPLQCLDRNGAPVFARSSRRSGAREGRLAHSDAPPAST